MALSVLRFLNIRGILVPRTSAPLLVRQLSGQSCDQDSKDAEKKKEEEKKRVKEEKELEEKQKEEEERKRKEKEEKQKKKEEKRKEKAKKKEEKKEKKSNKEKKDSHIFNTSQVLESRPEDPSLRKLDSPNVQLSLDRTLNTLKDQIDFLNNKIQEERNSTRDIGLITMYQEEIGFLEWMMEIHKRYPESSVFIDK